MDGSEAASARARKVVLIVDDDPGAVRVLANGIDGALRQFEVLTAHDGREAVEILDRGPVDAIVTDLNMPIMDGFELIAHVTNRSDPVPIVVLSGLSSGEVDERLRPFGGLRVLSKPAGYREVVDVIDELLEQIAPGRLEGIALASVVQLIEAERRSCNLIVTSGRRKGRLYFESGRLINAFSADFAADGEAAAYDILGWSDTAIAFEALPDEVRREIHTPLQLLLIEVAAVQDQLRERTERSIPPPPATASSADRLRPYASADAGQRPPRADRTDPGVDSTAAGGPSFDETAPDAVDSSAVGGATDDDAVDSSAVGGAADDDAAAADADAPHPATADDADAWPGAGDAAAEDGAERLEAAASATDASDEGQPVDAHAAPSWADEPGSEAPAAMPPEANPPPPAVDGDGEAPDATRTETMAAAGGAAADRCCPAADTLGGPSGDGQEGVSHPGAGAALGAATSPAGDAHVTRLVAAVERLTQRARDADTVLSALTDEIESFRLAQQHFDEENERRERRCQELEAFRNDVARLARQILGRVDELFVSRSGAEAAALEEAAATTAAIVTAAAASAATEGDPAP
jgi:CheY-like chemotaxis protein